VVPVHLRKNRAKRDKASDALDGNREHISDAALGLDEARCAWITLKFAPKAQDLHVDAPVEHVIMHAGRLQQMLAAERRWGASRKAESSAYSPLVRATAVPVGSVRRRVFESSCQPEKRYRPRPASCAGVAWPTSIRWNTARTRASSSRR
jgi:hypothetical protein